MSPEKQRVAIHRARGKAVTAFRFRCKNHEGAWLDSPHYRTRSEAEYWQHSESGWTEVSDVEEITSHENTPDYLADLNAMHEAEKVLTDEQMKRYIDELNDTVGRRTPGPGHPYWMVFNATAAQRSEAFLRTLGKWEETP